MVNTLSITPAMFVCLCHNITDGQIRQAMRERGLASLREVREHLGVGSHCGRCAQCARQVIAAELAQQRAVQSDRHCVQAAIAA